MENIKNYIIGILIFICLSFYLNNDKYKIDNETYRQNIEVLQDTIRHYKIDNNNHIAEKRAYISDINNLNNINRDLYDDINKLKKSINSVKPRSEEVKEVKAYSNISLNYRDSLNLNFETMFYRDRRNNIRYVVKSDNPDINVTKMDGLLVVPKRRFIDRFSLGIQSGVGVLYNPLTQRINPGIYVGAGLSYQLH